MSFFRKLRFFLIFLVFYFFICRIQEFLSLEHGWDWSGIVDPMKVRVKALKAILARRGISTDSSFERQDLVTLVRSSGRLTDVEMTAVADGNQTTSLLKKEIEQTAEEETDITDFSNVAHFDELVEDCKDSAWLVEIRQRGVPVLPVETWRRLTRYLRHFDFRIGRVDCYQRTMLCTRKTFLRSGLLLAMPKGRSRMKDSVIYSWFTKHPELPLILRWLEAALATRVPALEGSSLALDTIRNASLADDGAASSSGDFIVALDFERLLQVPLLFSALSVRFTGRVRFWRLDASAARHLFSNISSHNRSGTFFLLSSGARISYEYGAQPNRAEATTFRALALFLRMNYPEANDCLVGLSYPVCMLAMLSLALGRKGALHRILCCIASLLAYGLLFLVLYLPLEHLLSLRCLQSARLALLTFCRILTQSELGARIRSDCLSERYSALRVAIWFSVFLLIVAIFERRRDNEETEEEEAVRESQSRRPYIPEEAQMNHVVNYLYSSLWLPPDEWTKDYLEELPVWICAHDPSAASDEETAVGSGEESAEWPPGAVWSRQCSVCLCDFRRGVTLCGLPCGHVFHERCVKRWLQHPDRDSCPNCRWPAFKGK